MIYRQKPQKSKTIKTAPKTKTNMKNYIRGFFFCAMWYLSIIAGFFLLICPILPLVLISPKRYRRWSDRIFGLWEPFPVAMMEVCFGIRVILSGDKINPFEGSLFIMNHRTRVDWNFLWLGLFHCCQPNAHNMKYILKASLMHLPGPGWVMQTCSFIFIHRNWTRDKPLLRNIIDYLNESDSLYQILLFPEGTDLNPKSIRNSHKYAEENNLEKYYRVLHPRTTGFAFIARKMKAGGQLKAIYDVTIGYPKTPPQHEFDLLRGKFPEEVHFNVKRYSSSNISCNEEELKTWLTTVWKEKEEKLQRFYTTGCFTSNSGNENGLYNLTDKNLDFRKMSIRNGVIKYDGKGNPTVKEVSLVSVDRRSVKASTSKALQEIEEAEEEKSPAEEESDGVNQEAVSGELPPTTSGTDVEASPTDTDNVATGESSGSKSSTDGKPVTATESEIYARNHVNCEDVYRSKYYRPSHLLYLVLVFWITLIAITIHQLCYNIYLQIWVVTHSVLFLSLSFVSNGFHHFAAAMFFYKYGRKSILEKKTE